LILFLVATVLIFIFNFAKLEPYLNKYVDLTSIDSIVHESSLEKRFGGWGASLGMFKDHPLFGIGIGRFKQDYANYGVVYFSAWAYKQGLSSGYVPMISAHNMYLNYLAETGIPGIFLLMTIFSTIIIKGLSLIKKADSNYVFKYALLVSIVIFLGNNIFDGITFAYIKEIDKGMIFWSITAIIMSYAAIGKNQGNHFPERRRTWSL
jgi:O-antigen ligase